MRDEPAPQSSEKPGTIYYPFVGADGVPKFRECRQGHGKEKKIWQESYHPATGKWSAGVSGVERILYRLQELIAADVNEPVVIVEGPKDAETGRGLDFVTTTSPAGAGKWKYVAELARKILKDRRVVVIADADEAGRKHAEEVRASLHGFAKSVAVVECPGHKDLTDWVQSGATAAEVVQLLNSAEQSAAPESYVVHSRDAIWSKLAAVEWLVDGLVPKRSLALLIAYGSSLKTWIALLAAICIATGRPFFGFACAKGRVLIIDWESGKHELFRRIQAVCPDAIDGLDVVTMPAFFLNSPEFEKHLTEFAKTYALVIVDTLSAGSIDTDENDARFAAPLNLMKRVGERSEIGTSFLVLHHSKKQGPNGVGDEREAGRGTGAIFSAADCVLQLRKGKDDDGSMTLFQTKARGGKGMQGKPLTVTVDDITDEQGRAVVCVNAVAAKVEDPLADAKARILVTLANDHSLTTKTKVAEKAGGKLQQALQAFDALEKQKLIAKHAGVWRLKSEVEP